jgi:hypothetical protein
MRITSCGNVSIGQVTSPTAALHITTIAGGTPTIPTLGNINCYVAQYITNGVGGGSYGLMTGTLFNGNAWMQVQRSDGTATAYNLVLQPNGGSIGIGTSSPLAKLHVGDGTQSGINGAGNKIHIASATSGGRSALLTLANSSGAVTVEGQFESSAESADLRVIIGSTSNHDVVLRSNNVERMRITNGGYISVNSGAIYTSTGCVNTIVTTSTDFCYSGQNTSVANPRGLYLDMAGTSGGDYSIYCKAVGSVRFYVTGTGVIYSTNTSVQAISDVRHKENIRNLDKGLSEVLSLQPRLFDWKEGKGTGSKNVMGFIAQEVETIFPELISSWKETIDATESFKTIAMSNMIPYLVKAIQELTARVQYLENK